MTDEIDDTIDDAIAQSDGIPPDTKHALEDVGAETAAHAMLRVIGDEPGTIGRLRCARIIGGYAVPHRDEADAARLARYAIEIDWSLRELVRLVDALIDGKLFTQTAGPRPTLVLTRAGYAALTALEGGS